MNGFLHNLANRSLGTDTTIKPRLPGRFEPPSFNTSWPAFDEDKANSITREPADRQQEHYADKDTGHPPFKSLKTDEASIQRAFHSEPKTSYDEQEIIHGKSEASAMTVKLKNAQADKAGDLNHRFEAEVPHPDFKHDSSQIVKHFEDPTISGFKSEIGSAGTTSQDHDSSIMKPPDTQVGPMVRVKNTEILRSANVPPDFSQIGSKQTAAPTIKVTIGRVEVRAIMPPPVEAPARTRQAEPKLSLEDYLKRRNGGAG